MAVPDNYNIEALTSGVPTGMDESGSAALQLAGVTVTYPSGVCALKKTDLCIENNSVTVLLGPSGAGKSTLLRTLNLLVQPTEGQVLSSRLGELAGKSTIRAHRQRSAMIFQQHH